MYFKRTPARLPTGTCALCGRYKELVKDHDHDTGKKRSRICIACNSGLGLFQDDPEILMRAIEYLTFWNKAQAKHKKQNSSVALKIFKGLSPQEQERLLSAGGH